MSYTSGPFYYFRSSSDRLDIGVTDVLSLEEQRFSRRFCKCISKAVANFLLYFYFSTWKLSLRLVLQQLE